MDVSIIILNWNSADYLDKCLRSLALSSNNISTEIIVIDNGSTENPEPVCSAFAGVRLIRNATNKGVAPARNEGMKVASGRYIMILDVDTVVNADVLPRLVAYMDQKPYVGLAGPRLEYPDGTLQYSCRSFPTVLSKVLRRIPFGERALRQELLVEWNHRETRPVGYVIGACQLIRSSCVQDIGYLDDRIFYGPEDVDYCLRLWRAGYEVHYVGDVVVQHYERRITRKKIFTKITWLHGKGLIHYFLRHRYAFHRPTFLSREQVRV